MPINYFYTKKYVHVHKVGVIHPNKLNLHLKFYREGAKTSIERAILF